MPVKSAANEILFYCLKFLTVAREIRLTIEIELNPLRWELSLRRNKYLFSIVIGPLGLFAVRP